MFQIRFMTEQDLRRVAEIERETFSVPWSEKAFADSLKNENTLFIVAEKNGVVAGYFGAYISFHEGNVSNVAVSAECRRQGIAAKMLEAAFVFLGERKVTDIFLEVRETNIPAIRLYEQCGFQKIGIRKNFYEKPVENALVMWKHNL